MHIYRFEDTLSWQKPKSLNILVYGYLKNSKDYSFKDQIQRASVSVMNNIAEGFERNSDKELKQFLFIAKGSCGEVRSMLILALELQYIDAPQYEAVYNLALDVSKLLAGFIRKL